MKVRVVVFSLFSVIIALSGCVAATPMAPAAQPTAEAPPATVAPMPEAIGTTVAVAENAELGQFLADGDGMTLYLFTKDSPDESACYDQCAENWPPLITEGEPVAGEGTDAGLLGTTERNDGSMQVTYNGWPLYYFARDEAPGDTTGQDVGEVWYVVSPAGEAAHGEEAMMEEAMGATVAVAENAELGQFLADGDGMTLYLFTKDSPDESACYDQCAENWPPLITEGEPVAGEGTDAGLLGTTERNDGSMQVTYNGWPLYYFARDEAPGDTTGQDVGEVWYVVSPAGEAVHEGM